MKNTNDLIIQNKLKCLPINQLSKTVSPFCKTSNVVIRNDMCICLAKHIVVKYIIRVLSLIFTYHSFESPASFIA